MMNTIKEILHNNKYNKKIQNNTKYMKM